MMPTYNQRQFVDEAVASVIAQDYRPLQIVVCDDASTDGTGERVAQLARKHPDLLLATVNETNLGITGNCNKALAACTGEFVALTAGDDVMLPGKISAQVAWLQQSSSRVMCGHDVDVFASESGVSLGLYSARHPLSHGSGPEQLIRHGVLFAGCSVMLRRSALPPSLYDERMRLVSDWKLQVDVLSGGGDYGYVPGVLGRYRRHVTSASHLEADDLPRTRAFLEDRMVAATALQVAHPQHVVALRAAKSTFLHTAARSMVRLGEPREARALLRWAVRERPAVLPRALALGAVALMPAGGVRASQVLVRGLRRARGGPDDMRS